MTPAEEIALFRLLDAAANRAAEGLRGAEDYVRFVLDDAHLTGEFKQLRHDLADALATLDRGKRLAARNTIHDVGTQITTPGEETRKSLTDVFSANIGRLQEALRTLEEHVKLLETESATRIEALRYRGYTLAAAAERTRKNYQRLAQTRLCVLLDGCSSTDAFGELAESLFAAGADMIQLRDKELADRELVARASCLAEITRPQGRLGIVNDRPDIAAAARADGVHLGQDDLSVSDARRVIGSEMLIGISSHSIEQARQAVLEGADYLGVGPTFASATKSFEEFPGPQLLRQVAAEITLPAFAIGGITPANLPDVLETGFTRIAAAGSVRKAEDPLEAILELAAGIQKRGERGASAS